MSSTTATARQGVKEAPDRLFFVQDFLNTAGGGQPDLLADAASAGTWWRGTLEAWSSGVGLEVTPELLSTGDATRLVRLREELRAAMRTTATDATATLGSEIASATSSLGLRADTTVVAVPHGRGWKQVSSLLMIEMLAAQTRGEWRRLKTCRNEACGSVFFDRSKNNSGAWHDVAVCGNAVNLRASRARRAHRSEPLSTSWPSPAGEGDRG